MPLDLAKFVLSDYQIAELENAFRMFSPNADGKIHISKLLDILESFRAAYPQVPEMNRPLRVQSLSETSSPLIQPPSPDSTSSEQKSLTFTNDSEECDFETFLKLIEDQITSPETVEDNLTHTFQLLDIKKTGRIEASDLRAVAEILGEPIESEAEAQKLLSLMTLIESDSPNFGDFYGYVLKTLKPERSP